MSLTRNLLKLIFVYCPIIIVLLGLGCFVNKNIKIFSREAAPFISEIASDYLEIPCEVKSITLKGTSIDIKGLSAKDKLGNDLISAENIYIRLNPTTFTTHKITVATIKADKVKANIYRTDKKWNFEFLTHIFSRRGMSPTDVRGPIILITDSELTVSDNVTKYKDSLKNVNIRMDLRSNDCPKISMSLSSDYGNQIRLKTDFNKILHTADLSAEAKKLDLDAFNQYKNLIPGKTSFISDTSIKGTADAKVSIKIKSFKTVSKKIEISSKNLTAKTPYGTADKAQIYARLDNNILSFRTKGTCNKADTFAEGSFDIKHPETVKGKIRLKNAEAENFADLLPKEAKSLRGTFSIDCSVSQGLKNLDIVCSIKAKNPSYNNIDLKSLQFRGKLKNTFLDYELSAEGTGAYSGSLYAKGTLENFDLKKPDINKISSDSLINIRDFNINFITGFKGSANGDIAVKGNIAHPEISSNLSLSRGFLNLKKVAFTDIYAGMSLSAKEDILYVDSGLIQGFYNTDIFFNGSIDRKLNGKASLTVSSLNLETMGKDFNIDMGGKGALSAKITKKDSNFASDWTADIQNFRFKDQNLDHIQADFTLSDKAVAINQCTLLDFPATLQAKAYITPDRDDFLSYEKDKDPNFSDFSEDIPKQKFTFSDLKKYIKNIPDIYFDMECSCNNYSTKNLFRRLKQNNENIKAIADFSLNAKGIYSDSSLKELQGGGNINIDNLSLYDNPFSNVIAEFK
ncbi:MAG: hypothetical protein KBT47_00070, partial [Armatimonadetes bacterium]|nr:hypothetical protein [Candidatus Hippobium faecium]